MIDNSAQLNASMAAGQFTCHDSSIFLQAQSSLHTNYIISATFNTLFSFTAFIGNAIILVVLKEATSINRASNSFLCCLAMSDLMIGLIAQPVHVIYCIYGVIGGPQVRCYSRTIFQYTTDYFIAISFLTIVAITLDRYLTLCHRHKYRSTMTPGKTRGLIAFLWAVCLCFPLGRLVSPSTPMILSSAVFIAFLVIPSYSVYKIYRFLKQHKLQMTSQLRLHTLENNKMSGFNVSQFRKSVTTMLFVYFALLLCFLPSVGVTAVWLTSDRDQKLALVPVGNFSLTVLMFNSSLNPFLYCWRIREVRKKTYGLLKKVFFCSSGSLRGSYTFDN